MNNEIKKYTKAGRANLIVIYILFLCGIVAPILPIIGVIFAYKNKEVLDNTLSSHYIFILRTFYIGITGGIIYFCISYLGFILFPILVLFFSTRGVLYTGLLIWYILRIAIGLRYLVNYEPHPNYMTYWIK